MMIEQLWRSANARRIDILVSFASEEEEILANHHAHGKVDGTIIIGITVNASAGPQLSRPSVEGESIVFWKTPEDWFCSRGNHQEHHNRFESARNETAEELVRGEVSCAAELLISSIASSVA